MTKIKCRACQEEFEEHELLDAVYDNKLTKLCKRCIGTTDAMAVKKPVQIEIENVARRSVKEILNSMAGIKPEDIKNLKPIKKSSNITLEDLRERYDELKELKKQRKEEQEKIEQAKETEKSEKKQAGETEKPAEENREIRAEKILDFNLNSSKKTKIRDLLQMKKERETRKSVEREF